MLLALCRSPVSLGIFEKAAKDIWRGHIQTTRAGEVAEIQAAKAGIAWARVVIGQAATLTTSTAKFGRKEIMQALREDKELTGAHRAFGIVDADWKSAAFAAEKGGRK